MGWLTPFFTAASQGPPYAQGTVSGADAILAEITDVVSKDTLLKTIFQGRIEARHSVSTADFAVAPYLFVVLNLVAPELRATRMEVDWVTINFVNIYEYAAATKPLVYGEPTIESVCAHERLLFRDTKKELLVKNSSGATYPLVFDRKPGASVTLDPVRLQSGTVLAATVQPFMFKLRIDSPTGKIANVFAQGG